MGIVQIVQKETRRAGLLKQSGARRRGCGRHTSSVERPHGSALCHQTAQFRSADRSTDLLGKRGAADTLMLGRVVSGRLVPVAVIPMSAIMMRRMADRVRCLRKRHRHGRCSETQREQDGEQAAEHKKLYRTARGNAPALAMVFCKRLYGLGIGPDFA
jgi:hypothetical protein